MARCLEETALPNRFGQSEKIHHHNDRVESETDWRSNMKKPIMLRRNGLA